MILLLRNLWYWHAGSWVLLWQLQRRHLTMSMHSYLKKKHLSLSLSPSHRYTCDIYVCTRTTGILLRMRAALFLNAVTIRQCVSTSNGWILSQCVLQKLLTANYLFHASLNCKMAQVMHAVQWDRFWCCKFFFTINLRACPRGFVAGPLALEDQAQTPQVSWC